MIKKGKQNRLHLIDEYRGFWLVNMIFYHAIWDLVYIFGHDWAWYRSQGADIWQQCICWSFIFVSGFCWKMSRRHLRRGLEVFGGGLLITIATLLFMPNSRVIFGVLTLIGSSMLLMIPCEYLFEKISPLLGAVISFVTFLFVKPVNEGYFGFGEMELITLPREWYSNLFSTYLGFPEPGFWSTDYFSIFPWFFLFATGYFVYRIVFANDIECEMQKESSARKILQKSICPPLGFVGRNSLLIYMLHQPVVYGILYLCHMFD